MQNVLYLQVITQDVVIRTSLTYLDNADETNTLKVFDQLQEVSLKSLLGVNLYYRCVASNQLNYVYTGVPDDRTMRSHQLAQRPCLHT